MFASLCWYRFRVTVGCFAPPAPGMALWCSARPGSGASACPRITLLVDLFCTLPSGGVLGERRGGGILSDVELLPDCGVVLSPPADLVAILRLLEVRRSSLVFFCPGLSREQSPRKYGVMNKHGRSDARWRNGERPWTDDDIFKVLPGAVNANSFRRI